MKYIQKTWSLLTLLILATIFASCGATSHDDPSDDPITGTIINKYIEENELAYQGKPLFKIADLTNMFIKVYITEDELASVKLNQSAIVRLDNKKGKPIKLDGTVTWISPKAEFTPKMIQTKEERVNLVYAVKVSFKNDGSAKIGMPGDVVFK